MNPVPFDAEQIFEQGFMLVMIAFSVPMLALITFLLQICLGTVGQLIQALADPHTSTMGTVQARETILGQGSNSALYLIEFVHNGQRYRFQQWFNHSIYSQNSYQLNDRVRVYFHPDAPQRATLIPASAGSGLLLLVMAGGFLWLVYILGSIIMPLAGN